MKLKRLTSEDFERFAALTGLGDSAREMARAVLVAGRQQTDVATEYGMTKQRVKLAVDVISRVYFQSTAPGNGLVSVELVLPESLAVTLASFVESLNSNTDDDVKSKALKQALDCFNAAKLSLA